MAKEIKLGLIQMSCFNDLEANFQKTIEKIQQAAASGAQIVFTQELFKSPYL